MPRRLVELMTSDQDRRLLLGIARSAIAARVAGIVPPEVVLDDRRGAAFVTLHKAGALRGCIGHTEIDQPLATVVARCAVSAAVADPRFPPVALSELPYLDIEISILGPIERIEGVEQVVIGLHGLVVERGRRRGLLLPQVAGEWGWSPEAFIAQTCVKAGLPSNAWARGATLWRFEAEVFGDACGVEEGG